jgi:hypothetical protein
MQPKTADPKFSESPTSGEGHTPKQFTLNQTKKQESLKKFHLPKPSQHAKNAINCDNISYFL